jgi:hypothetical protein
MGSRNRRRDATILARRPTSECDRSTTKDCNAPQPDGGGRFLVERFTETQADLDRERKAMTRLWAKREEQIHGVVETMAGLYGDLQGIAGRSLQEIDGWKCRCSTGRQRVRLRNEGPKDHRVQLRRRRLASPSLTASARRCAPSGRESRGMKV